MVFKRGRFESVNDLFRKASPRTVFRHLRSADSLLPLIEMLGYGMLRLRHAIMLIFSSENELLDRALPASMVFRPSGQFRPENSVFQLLRYPFLV